MRWEAARLRTPGEAHAVASGWARYVSVVELVGRDQVAHLSQRVDLGPQALVELRGRPQKEVPVGEPDDHHAGGEGYRTTGEGHPS